MTEGPTRILFIGADTLVIGTNDIQQVGILLKGIEKQPGMNPDLGIALAMTPTEARSLSASLLRMADAAEAGSSLKPEKLH